MGSVRLLHPKKPPNSPSLCLFPETALLLSFLRSPASVELHAGELTSSVPPALSLTQHYQTPIPTHHGPRPLPVLKSRGSAPILVLLDDSDAFHPVGASPVLEPPLLVFTTPFSIDLFSTPQIPLQSLFAGSVSTDQGFQLCSLLHQCRCVLCLSLPVD